VKLLRTLEGLSAAGRRGAVSIGNFDGVHRGHARIVERLRARAREVGGPAVVLTFDPPPSRLLRPDLVAEPLTTTARKAELLAELGVDLVWAYPTHPALLRQTPDEFFADLLQRQLDARYLVEGPDFHFGRARAGTIDVLRQLCAAASVGLEIVPPLEASGQQVSSSQIRALLKAGQVAEAVPWLGRPHRVAGEVVPGARRGTGLGFPTANVAHVETLLPGPGVYAGRAWIDTRAFPAAINLGPNPTFHEQSLKLEVHVLDWDGSLYGRTVAVDFLQQLRATRKFASVQDLQAQLQLDVTAARQASLAFASASAPPLA